jgi:hypothetical protein
MGPIRSRAPAHEAPSPVYGGRLGWGHSAVAPNTVPRHRPTPPTQPPPARAEGGVVSASEAARPRTKPLPPFTGEGWDGGTRQSHPTPCLATARRPPPNLPPLARREECRVHPKSRARARSPFPRLRGKAGMGALGGCTQHRASPTPDAPHPTSPRSRGGRSGECIRSRAYAHKAPSPACGGRLGWASKPRVRARSPFPRLRGKVGMGALGGCTQHRAAPASVPSYTGLMDRDDDGCRTCWR